jgi:hypothetical protein
MQVPRGGGAIVPTYSTLALDGVSGCHAPAVLYPWEMNPGIPWTGGWVGLRAGLDTEAKGKILCICRGSNPGRLACSQTLYCLSYPSSLLPLWNLKSTKLIQVLHFILWAMIELLSVSEEAGDYETTGSAFCFHTTVTQSLPFNSLSQLS